MASLLAIMVNQHVRDHLVRWGEFLPVVQYHMRHSQWSRSGFTPRVLVHGWAATEAPQRAVAPWDEIPCSLPLDEWSRELLAGRRAVHEQFRPFLDEYATELVRRKNADAKVKVAPCPGTLAAQMRPP